MRKVFSLGLLCVMCSFIFVGCGPPKLEMLEEIMPNETAYLISLEGDTKENQDVFKSVEYLEAHKVAAKRVSLSQRQVSTGRAPWNYKWMPTEVLIRVDRAPITREWTSSTTTGTTAADQGIHVESKDSIGFSVGINITAFIDEPDVSKYLYKYAKKPLSDVVDENVRGYVQSVLSVEFGSRELVACMAAKKEISEILSQKCIEQFRESGITISYIGLAEGLMFENKEVQNAIDKKFTSEMSIQSAKQEALAQEEKNKLTVSKAKAEREAAEEFQKAIDAQTAKLELEIRKTLAEKWDGKFPANIVPENSNFLFNLDTSSKPSATSTTSQKSKQEPAPKPLPAPTTPPVEVPATPQFVTFVLKLTGSH